ncbi:hypothetical protein [Ruminococcus sp.]|uniref:hypothetical protein n=1 Tax=Ruminococcus sp. TaxID=41978 RepID=UPI003AB3A176
MRAVPRFRPRCRAPRCGTLPRVDADYSCKKWVYDPIKRVPKKQLNIPNQEDDVI